MSMLRVMKVVLRLVRVLIVDISTGVIRRLI